MKNLPHWMALTGLSVAVLAGCSSDDSSDSSSSYSYIQFYNGSVNSSPATLTLNDRTFSNISFGDTTSLYSISPDSYELSVTANDSTGDEYTLISYDTDLAKGDYHLYALAGDFADPELMTFTYELEELEEDDDLMQLHFANLATTNQDYDVYLGLAGGDFESADFIESMSYGSFTAQNILGVDEYTVYLTEPGETDVIFESSDISMTSETVYFLVIRDNYNPGSPKLTIDRLNTSSSVLPITDAFAVAEYRVLNGLQDKSSVVTEMESASDLFTTEDIAYGETSEYLEVPFNDYNVSVKSGDTTLINNVLLTLNQGESKTMVVYNDEEGQPSAFSYDQDLRPLAFNNMVDFVNLSSDQTDIDVYFVADDETIETATYSLTGVSLEEVDDITVPTDVYEITVVYEDDNDNSVLLYQSNDFEMESGINYSMVLIKDDNEQFGYRLNIIASN